ncbi:MAG: dienelactone hydrolase family protein [Rhodospirillales bacterium]
MTALPRRRFLGAAAGLPLAAVLADAKLTQAAADSLQTVEISTKAGRTVTGALALPATLPAPAVLLIHEWWGLNPQIKAVAAELANQGYVALACDLYEGKVADEPDQARALMGAVDSGDATDTLVSWVDNLKNGMREEGHTSGPVASIGWCFGGGWALNTALATPIEGCVVYYGRVNKTAAELAPLACPVLGQFATKDKWINKEMVDGFEAAMKDAGKTAEIYWYEADHAFANPTQARYDAADAKLAWERTSAYFKAQLG